ncbi:hypothetical protein MTR67_030871 [Solanum verrucosum]|uniref:Uncharacterized protein n=1 Tax=Solanum verrucosum TaxID=315347 RepID=A0AAF0ZCU2_SOLVR|nr:hypothetical protein MTR67_030871 [Solanum verrucosum]
MEFMLMCSPITRVFSMYSIRKSLILDRGDGWSYSRVMT